MNAMNDIHKKVLRKFHTLCSVVGMTQDEKRSLISSYGVESSADIDTHDLIDICAALSKQAGQDSATRDALRKRCFAAIGGYLRLVGREENPDLIRGIACRCTGYDDFNKIPAERLRNVYSTFCNKQNDIRRAETVAAEIASAGAVQSGKYMS